MTIRPCIPRRRHDDTGVVTSIELMYVCVFAMISIAFLGYLGRSIAAGVEVTNAAQDGARAASIARDPASAQTAAVAAISRSGLPSQCRGTANADFTWQPSEIGGWQGGTVTVTVTCQVTNRSLSTVWTPGVRTITVTDTQVVDRYRR
jgi:Flp pilus assembly protein TadG